MGWKGREDYVFIDNEAFVADSSLVGMFSAIKKGQG